MNFLERLRKKPKYVRTQYAFLSAVFITAVLGAFWYASFLVKQDTPVAVLQDKKESSRVAEHMKKFFSGLQQRLSDVLTEETNPSLEEKEDSADKPKLTPASEMIIDSEFKPAAQATTSTTSAATDAEKEKKPVLIRTTGSATTTATDIGR